MLKKKKKAFRDFEGIAELSGQMELNDHDATDQKQEITEVRIAFYTTFINLIIYQCT